MEKQPVRIARNAAGEPVGVIIETLDMLFGIELRHVTDEQCDWDTAMAILADSGKCAMTKTESLLLATYHTEVNAALVQAGGQRLETEWTAEQYDENTAWIYQAGLESVYRSEKGYWNAIRATLSDAQIEEIVHA